MRYLFGFVCVLALAVVPFLACGGDGDSACALGSEGCACNEGRCLTGLQCLSNLCVDPGGAGGTGGTGGDGGTGGMPECASPEDCEDDGNECTAAQCTGGACQTTPLDDGTVCTEGECHQGACTPVFACTEQGIRAAIAEGGGPHFFACGGPTTVVTTAEIVIDNDVILDGEGELTVDGNMGHRVFSVTSETITAELRGITVTGGVSAGDEGGGINNFGTLTLTNSTVSGNTADLSGGGIVNGGTLTLTNSTVSGNTAGGGGGILNLDGGTLTLTNSTVSGNTGDFGGGINNAAANGTLTLTNSTVSGNTGFFGGGINNGGTLTLTNSTVSDNTGGDEGGGINNFGTLTLTNSTVSGNTGEYEGGGLINAGQLDVANSTVSDNTAAGAGDGIYYVAAWTVRNSLFDDDCAATLSTLTVSQGGNLESLGNTCDFNGVGDQVKSIALNLGPLADNGGPTMTHALLPGSVAIDRVPEAMCLDAAGDPLTTDQRGQPRRVGMDSKCDVGAFEVQP